jgi:hypothetical protein
MSAEQRRLVRQLEGRLRNAWHGQPLRDIRWQLTQTGMTTADIDAVERPIRRTIRTERTRRAAA